jgi:hypothetical protein
MNKRQLLIALAFSMAHTPSHAAVEYPMDIVPLYELRNDPFTDHFYTVSEASRDSAISQYGYYYKKLAGFMPQFSEPAVGITPFARFWKDAPEYDHFYTHLNSEAEAVVGMGWIREGNEGSVFRSPANGILGLVRLNLWNPSTGDLQHAYTTDEAEAHQWLAVQRHRADWQECMRRLILD